MRNHQIGAWMRVRCYLREIRGRRSLRAIAETSGINRGSLSTIERGTRLPTDDQVEQLEQAYGVPFEQMYHRQVIRVLEPDEEVPA